MYRLETVDKFEQHLGQSQHEHVIKLRRDIENVI